MTCRLLTGRDAVRYAEGPDPGHGPTATPSPPDSTRVPLRSVVLGVVPGVGRGTPGTVVLRAPAGEVVDRVSCTVGEVPGRGRAIVF